MCILFEIVLFEKLPEQFQDDHVILTKRLVGFTGTHNVSYE